MEIKTIISLSAQKAEISIKKLYASNYQPFIFDAVVHGDNSLFGIYTVNSETLFKLKKKGIYKLYNLICMHLKRHSSSFCANSTKWQLNFCKNYALWNIKTLILSLKLIILDGP